VTITNNTTDLDIPLVAFTSLSNGAHTINMTNLAAGTQTQRFDVHYALVTVGDGNLLSVQCMGAKITSLTVVCSSTYANITLDDTSPNVSYSRALVDCNNGLNPQYHNNTFQLVYCSLQSS
jgi:hypothetical protein